MELALFVIVATVVVIGQVVIRWSEARAQAGLERPAMELAKQGRRLDASELGDVAEASLVRVLGEVKKLERWVVAPISKRPCAHWSLSISVMEYSPAARGVRWRVVARESDGLPFTLSSAKESCLVDPSLATVQVDRDGVEETVRGRALSSAHAECLERAGVPAESVMRTKVRFTENILGFGSRVAVVGCGRLAPRLDATNLEVDYRAARPTWLSFTGNDDELLISDDRRLLRPRGTGGGIKTEAVSSASLSSPSQSEAWGAMDVDEFQRRLATRRTLWLRASILLLIVVGAGVLVRRFTRTTPPKTSATVTPDPEQDCDMDAIAREFASHGAAAVREKIAKFDSHCGLTPDYRRLHFSVMRAEHDTAAAADDADQLLKANAGDADLWLAISAGKDGTIDTLRQAVALSETDSQRQEAIAMLSQLESAGTTDPCSAALAHHGLSAQAATPPRECALRGRGHATFTLAPARVDGRIGNVGARIAVDPRVGTTIVSETFATRAKLISERDPRRYAPSEQARTAFQKRLVVGERVVVASITVGTTSATNLPVIVDNWLEDVDVVVGLDYLWRFADSAADSGAVRMSEWP